MDLCIPKRIVDEIVAQAKAVAPIEACGILAGCAGQVKSFYPMTNADNSPDHFTMEPKEQFSVVKKIRESGQQMLAIYHSHPASPARPSAEDIRLALTPDVVYVIVSLASGDGPVVKGFLIEDGAVNEVPVHVAESGTDRTDPTDQAKVGRPVSLILPESVRQDAQEYRSRVEAFLRGDTSPIAFRAYRVPMGIYEQRTSGHYMVRVRIAAGIALPAHLRTIARLTKQYGNGVLHVTTRQDIQIHDVAIEDTPAVLEGLLEAGLSSRGGGGNTVRNISSSPSGICPTEKFDVAPYAVALAEYLLQHKSSFNLPRKYKIAFSGCDDDCGQASVADLGFFAQFRQGRRGFSVFAGGGLGGEPRPGILIEEFVTEEEIFEIAEAIRRLFDRHGDRANKHKARLRFVVTRVGEDEFRTMYQQERAAIRKEGLPGAIPIVRETASSNETSDSSTMSTTSILPEKGGRYSVRVRLPLGDIVADALSQVAELAEHVGAGIVRTTQLQDLLLPRIPGEKVARVIDALRILELGQAEETSPKIVACTGAATCKLGLCLSRELAKAIGETFAQRGLVFNDISGAARFPAVRISGCPNSCGGHQIAAIGLEGGARRVNGRLMPVYSVFVDGRLSSKGATLAEKVAIVPAKRIPDLLADAFVDGHIDPQRLRDLSPDYEKLPTEIPEDFFSDFGANESFSLAGRGPGECGAGVLDVIRVDIEEARDALRGFESEENEQALYRALVAAARSLLVIFGVEVKKDREIFDEFEQRLVEPGWVGKSTKDVINAAVEWRLGDRDSLAEFAGDIERLVALIETLFLSLDGDLKFRIAPIIDVPQLGDEVSRKENAKIHEIDLSGVACPMNFVKAKVALERIPVGEILEVQLDDGEPIKNVPASFAEQGQEVLSIEPIRDAAGGLRHLLRIRRKK